MIRPATKVFIVDDHAFFRSGLRSELAGKLLICGEAGDVDSAVAGIVAQRPAVVLLDVHLPGATEGGATAAGGRTVIERVLEQGVETCFLALSASEAPEDVIDTVHAGARGYVTKTIGADELVDAVRRVAEGDVVFSPRLAGFVLDAFSALPLSSIDEDLALLTEREREVLQHVARGYTYREIAAALHISIKTVESHVSAVLRKLQLTNRRELSRWAAERNIR